MRSKTGDRILSSIGERTRSRTGDFILSEMGDNILSESGDKIFSQWLHKTRCFGVEVDVGVDVDAVAGPGFEATISMRISSSG